MNNNTKVLIGDDSAGYGVKVANKLRNYGFYTYTRRKDGNVLLDAIVKDMPDVVVIDMDTINIDALSLIRRVKRTDFKSPSFIVTSSYENSFVQKQIMDSGASYFLLKPFDCEGLCEIINDIIQNNEQQSCDTIESIVTEIIYKIGIPAKLKGFGYLRTAIIASFEHPGFLTSVTTQLYPFIANQYNTTSSRVERNIRHAIDHAWSKGKPEILGSLLGYSFEVCIEKPTNAEFIALITHNIIMKYKCSPITM